MAGAGAAVCALLDGAIDRVRRRYLCDRCGRSNTVALQVDQGERMCQPCRDQTDRDDRLDDLVGRATATVEEMHFRGEDWPNDEETEELEIRLRALGPDVEIAWRAFVRAASESNAALDRGDRTKTVARGAAKDKLLAAITSARLSRRPA